MLPTSKIVTEKSTANFEVLSEIDEEKLAGALAARVAVVRWPPEQQ